MWYLDINDTTKEFKTLDTAKAEFHANRLTANKVRLYDSNHNLLMAAPVNGAVVREGDSVRVAKEDSHPPGDNWPEHDFIVIEVIGGTITGVSSNGPFAGEYGELEFDQVLYVERNLE